MRHSGISWALASGIPASDVARFAGSSVTMLETRYHHLLTSSLDTARERLDAFTTGARAHNEAGSLRKERAKVRECGATSAVGSASIGNGSGVTAAGSCGKGG